MVYDEGEEYGAVTAQDFVTGIKHAVESKSEGLFPDSKFDQRSGCLCKRGKPKTLTRLGESLRRSHHPIYLGPSRKLLELKNNLRRSFSQSMRISLKSQGKILVL